MVLLGFLSLHLLYGLLLQEHVTCALNLQDEFNQPQGFPAAYMATDSCISPELPTQRQRSAGPSIAHAHNSDDRITEIYHSPLQMIPLRTLLAEVLSCPPPVAPESPRSAPAALPRQLLQHWDPATAPPPLCSLACSPTSSHSLCQSCHYKEMPEIILVRDKIYFGSWPQTFQPMVICPHCCGTVMEADGKQGHGPGDHRPGLPQRFLQLSTGTGTGDSL